MENEQPPTYLNLSISLEPNIELQAEVEFKKRRLKGIRQYKRKLIW